MVRIANFEKISREQWIKDIEGILNVPDEYKDDEYFESINTTYDLIILPQRSTSGSGGYDFYAPMGMEIKPGQSAKIPTGIRCKIDEGWVLGIYPRSSLGFKYQVGLANTIGIIDSDYYYADNDGHIWIKLVNRGDKKLNIEADDKFAQGIFTPYGITYDDDVTEERHGGIGSTGK